MSAKPEILWTKEELWEISRERTETIGKLQALNAELVAALEACISGAEHRKDAMKRLLDINNITRDALSRAKGTKD